MYLFFTVFDVMFPKMLLSNPHDREMYSRLDISEFNHNLFYAGGRSEQRLTLSRVWTSWSLVVVCPVPSSAPSTPARSCGSSVSPATSLSAWTVPSRCIATTAAVPRMMSSIAMETASESWLPGNCDLSWSVWRSHCRRWIFPLRVFIHSVSLQTILGPIIFSSSPSGGRFPGGFAGTGGGDSQWGEGVCTRLRQRCGISLPVPDASSGGAPCPTQVPTKHTTS